MIQENSNEEYKIPTAQACVKELLRSIIQVEIFHLRTNDYAEHEALKCFYKSLIKSTDIISEACIGADVIEDLSCDMKIIDYVSKDISIQYIEKLKDFVSVCSDMPRGARVEIDNLITDIDSTLYKLKKLS